MHNMRNIVNNILILYPEMVTRFIEVYISQCIQRLNHCCILDANILYVK